MPPCLLLLADRAASSASAQAGLTLIELLVALALAVLLVTLAAPRLSELVLSQRLKGVQTELLADLQLARSEALRRNRPVRIDWGADGERTCYVISAPTDSGDAGRCDCLPAGGATCAAGREEIRTARVARATGVALAPQPDRDVRIEPVRGSVTPAGFWIVVQAAATGAAIRTTLSGAGQPAYCASSGALSPITPCS